MERIIKSLTIIFFILTAVLPVSANQTQSPKKAILADCIKTYPLGFEKLYYITLAAINENDYKITEIQTKGGYIGFADKNRKYLAAIIYVSSAKSMLKIMPYDGVYNFTTDLPKSIFKYVEIYQNKN